MPERMKDYLAKLKNQSSEDLDRAAQELAVREKDDSAQLIAHLAEIGDRNYYLELRYKSLFEYCVVRLNLSEGSVYRRTQVAGVCREHAQILEARRCGVRVRAADPCAAIRRSSRPLHASAHRVPGLGLWHRRSELCSWEGPE